MDPQIVIVCAELLYVIGNRGVKEYLQHRKFMIEEGRQDELITYKVKKFSTDVYNKMSSRENSRDNTPMRLERVYEDEEEEKVDERQSITEALMKMPINQKQRKSIMGVNWFNRLSKTLDKPTVEKVIETTINPEFEKFVKDVFSVVIHEYHILKDNPNQPKLKYRHYRSLFEKTLSMMEKEK